MGMIMCKQIDLKFRISDLAEMRQKLSALPVTGPTDLSFKEVFFHSKQGVLKLRILSETAGQLIYAYSHSATQQALTDYQLSLTDSPAVLQKILSETNGIKGCLTQKRRLYLYGRTRVHLDFVEGLGDFLELEVVLEQGENLLSGNNEVDYMMSRLGLTDKDLISGPYLELLENNSTYSQNEKKSSVVEV